MSSAASIPLSTPVIPQTVGELSPIISRITVEYGPGSGLGPPPVGTCLVRGKSLIACVLRSLHFFLTSFTSLCSKPFAFILFVMSCQISHFFRFVTDEFNLLSMTVSFLCIHQLKLEFLHDWNFSSCFFSLPYLRLNVCFDFDDFNRR